MRWTFGVLLVSLALLLTGCGPQTAAVDFGDAGIIILGGWTGSEEYGTYKIEGTLWNNGQWYYDYLEVWATLYDSSGTIIGKDFTNFVELGPNEKRSLTIYVDPAGSVSHVAWGLRWATRR